MKLLNRVLFSEEDMSTMEKIGGYLFWLAFFFEIIYLIFKRIDYDLPLETYWLRAMTVCFGIKVLCTKYTKKEWVIIIAGGLLGIVAYYFSGRDILFRMYAMVVASKGISRDTALKTLYISLLFSFGLCIVRGIMGIGYPIVDVRDYGRGGVEARYNFGFSHANMCHYSFWVVIAVGTLLLKEKVKWWYLVIAEVLNVLLYLFTISRTGFLVSSFFIIMVLVGMGVKEKWFDNLVLFGGVSTQIVVCVISWLAAKYGIGGNFNNLLLLLNKLLTGRVAVAGWTCVDYQLRLFSNQNLPYVDMGYVKMAFNDGLICCFLYILLTMLLLVRCWQNHRRNEAIFLITLILYNFIESVQASNIYSTQSFLMILLVDTWYYLLGRERVNVRESQKQLD